MVTCIFKSRFLCASALCLFIITITGCVETKSKPEVSTLNKISCAEQVNINPKVIYQQMTDCISKSQNKRAAYLYAQAGTLTWYQSLIDKREASRIAHKNLPNQALSKLSKSEREDFVEIIETTFDNSITRQEICAQLIAPQTAYSHGEENRYSDKWLLAKKGYLHCI